MTSRLRSLRRWPALLAACGLPFTIAGEAWAVDGRVIYGDSATAWINERAWTAGDFGGAGSTMTNTAAAPWWIVYRDSPVQNVAFLGTQATNGQILFQCYDQSAGAWNNAVAATCNSQFTFTCAASTCRGTVDDDFRGFDVAFEQLSGDALFVYEDSITADTTLNVRRWNVAGPNTIVNPGALTIWGAANIARWIMLIPKPNSDDIMALILDDGGTNAVTVRAVRWNGSTDTWATVKEFTTTGTLRRHNMAAFAWEALSGDGVECSGDGGVGVDLQCWTYTNATDTWAAQVLNTPEDPATGMNEIEMASNPNSNHISLIYRAAARVASFIWDGTQWETTPAPPAADTTANSPGTGATAQSVNVSTAWESSGGQALFTYVDASSQCVGYWTYTVGVGWSASTIGTPGTGTTACTTGFPVAHPPTQTFTGGAGAALYQALVPSPATDEIMLVGIGLGGASPAGDIRASRWDGDKWVRMTTNTIAAAGQVSSTNDDNYGMVAFDWIGPKNKPYKQSSYMWCNNTTELDPTSGCSAVDTAITGVDWSFPTDAPVARHLRIALNVQTGGATFASGTTVKLQYAGGAGSISNCANIDGWKDIGDADDTNKAWRGYNANDGGSPPADGATILTNLATATIKESYEESLAGSILAASPNNIAAGSTGEWGFQIENYNANAGTDYCFRIVDSNGEAFRYYSVWPKITTSGTQAGVLLYGNSTTAGQPRRRDWTTDLSAECASSCASGAAATAIGWISAKGIQGSGATGSRADELIVGTANTAATAQLNVWTFNSTGGWTQRVTNTNTNSALATTRSFDVGYEATYGKALVVAENATSDTILNYYTWDGTTITGPCTWDYSSGARAGGGSCSTTAAATCAGAVAGNTRWVKLIGRTAGSEIMVLFEDSNFDLYGVTWQGMVDGGTFLQCQEATATACNNSVTNPCFDFAWARRGTNPASQPGRGIILYGSGTTLETRTYAVDTGWSGATTNSPFNPTVATSFARLAPDTGSSYVAAIIRYGAAPEEAAFYVYDADAAAWSSPTVSGWTNAIVTDVESPSSQNVDVAWETGTGKAVFVYVDDSATAADIEQVSYVIYDRVAGSWSPTVDPDTTPAPVISIPICDDVEMTALRPSPSSQEIMLLVQGASGSCTAATNTDLQAWLWNGAEFKASNTMRTFEDAPSVTSSTSAQIADFVWTRKDPTLVQLVSFRGYSRGQNVGAGSPAQEGRQGGPYADGYEVILEWETAAEWSNAGFNLYRSLRSKGDGREARGETVKINRKMIQGLGTSFKGRKYALVDSLSDLPPTAYRQSPVYYWLEDIEFSGKRTMHGPIEVRVGLDSDGDGMPDDWERAYGGNCGTSTVAAPFMGASSDAGMKPAATTLSACIADADGDADGDGISNLLEYLNGTVPTAIESGVWITDLAAFQERGRAQAHCGDRSCFDKLSTSGEESAHPEPVEGWRVVREDSTGLELECKREGCVEAAFLSVPAGANLVDSPGVKTNMEGIFRDQSILGVSAEEAPEDVLRARVAWSPEFRVGAGMPAQTGDQGRPYGVSTHDLTDLLDSVVLNRSRWAQLSPESSALGADPNLPGGRRSPSRIPSGPLWKVITRGEGIHKLTGSELRSGGVDVDGFAPGRLGLMAYAGGEWKESAILITGGGDGRIDPQDSILFYAEEPEGKYSDEKVYLLTVRDTPARVASVEATVDASLPFTTESSRPFRFERNELYWPALPSFKETADRWFFKEFATYDDPRDWIFDVPGYVPGMAAEGVDVTLTFLGAFDYTTVPIDHHLKVELNGEPAGILEWGGGEETTRRIRVPASILRERGNRLTFAPLLAPGVEFDRVLLNSVALDVTGTLRALNDAARATGTDEANVEVGGFTAPPAMVWDVSNPLSPVDVRGVQMEGVPPDVRARWGPRGGSYWISSERGLKKPSEIVPIQLGTTANESGGADLIIIAAPSMWSILEPLKQLREGEGLRVRLIRPDDIYFEYGNGSPSPHSIKDFLRNAFTTWPAPKPSYVLLVGDATYDYKGYEGPWVGFQGPVMNGYVPTYLLYTPLGGEVPADAWFVSFDDSPFDKLRVSGEETARGEPVEPRSPGVDLYPDMAIGRLPARTHEELAAMVDKIVHYADEPVEAEWRRNVLLVADKKIPGFEAISEGVLNLAPASLVMSRGYLSLFQSPADLTGGLVGEIDKGASVVNYVGHGSAQFWAAEKILGNEQLELLNNVGRYPFISTLTCINGYFAYPPSANFESMAEEYLRAPGRGAVAFFAPSGMSTPGVHAALSRALHQALLVDRINPIGAAIGKAYLDLSKEFRAGRLEFVPQMFNLFGDPSMALILPASDAPSTGDGRRVTGNGTGCGCAQVGAPVEGASAWVALSGLIGLFVLTRVLRFR